MVSPLKRREQVVNVDEFVLESWEELKEELRMIKKEREELARQPESTHVSELLYRAEQAIGVAPTLFTKWQRQKKLRQNLPWQVVERTAEG